MRKIICTDLKEIDAALLASWCGESVSVDYLGNHYALHEDVNAVTSNGSHVALMIIVCPSISELDSVDTLLHKYGAASSLLC